MRNSVLLAAVTALLFIDGPIASAAPVTMEGGTEVTMSGLRFKLPDGAKWAVDLQKNTISLPTADEDSIWVNLFVSTVPCVQLPGWKKGERPPKNAYLPATWTPFRDPTDTACAPIPMGAVVAVIVPKPPAGADAKRIQRLLSAVEKGDSGGTVPLRLDGLGISFQVPGGAERWESLPPQKNRNLHSFMRSRPSFEALLFTVERMGPSGDCKAHAAFYGDKALSAPKDLHAAYGGKTFLPAHRRPLAELCADAPSGAYLVRIGSTGKQEENVLALPWERPRITAVLNGLATALATIQPQSRDLVLPISKLKITLPGSSLWAVHQKKSTQDGTPYDVLRRTEPDIPPFEVSIQFMNSGRRCVTGAENGEAGARVIAKAAYVPQVEGVLLSVSETVESKGVAADICAQGPFGRLWIEVYSDRMSLLPNDESAADSQDIRALVGEMLAKAKLRR